MKKDKGFLKGFFSAFCAVMIVCVPFSIIPVKAAWQARLGDNAIKINNFLISVTLGVFDKSYVFFEDNPQGINGFLSNYYESPFTYQSKINFHENMAQNFKSVMHVLAYYRILIIYKIVLSSNILDVAPEICVKLKVMHNSILKASAFEADSTSIEAWWYIYGYFIQCKGQETPSISPDDFKKTFNLEYGAFLKSEFQDILYCKFFSNPHLKSVLHYIRANGCTPVLCLGSSPKSVIPGDNVFGVPLNLSEAIVYAINGSTKLWKYERDIDESYIKNIEEPYALFTHMFMTI